MTSLQVPSDSGPLTYTFSYDPQNGELQTATLPSGAATTYTFRSLEADNPTTTQPSVDEAMVGKQVTWTDQSDGGATLRTEPWSYTYNVVFARDRECSSNCTTVITHPDNGQETVYFHQGGASDSLFGLPVKVVQSSGETVEYLYYQNRPYGSQGIDPANPYPYLTVHSKASSHTPTVSAVVVQTIDKNGNPTKSTAYDWISSDSLQHDGFGNLSGFTPGTVLRTTADTYTVFTSDAGTGSEPIAGNGNEYWNPNSPSLLASSIITGAGPGAVAGYTYDPRGNQLNESHWDSSRAPSAPAPSDLNRTNAAVIDRTFDSYGNLTQTTDPNGNITKYTYDSNNLYLRSSVQGFGTSKALTTNYTQDFSTGLLTSQTDANGVTTCYGYDPLGPDHLGPDCR